MFNFNKKNIGYQVKLDNKYTLESSRMGIKWLKEQIKLINSSGYISEELGRELEAFFSDVGYIGNDKSFSHLGYNAGIHLTGYTEINEEYINDVFNNGLINNGHAMHGGGENKNAPSIDLTVTPFDSIIFAIRHLKFGATYKSSKAGILIKYPKELERDNETLEYFDGVTYRIYPNFIYGIVLINENNIVGDLIKNPNYNLSENLQRDSKMI